MARGLLKRLFRPSPDFDDDDVDGLDLAGGSDPDDHAESTDDGYEHDAHVGPVPDGDNGHLADAGPGPAPASRPVDDRDLTLDDLVDLDRGDDLDGGDDLDELDDLVRGVGRDDPGRWSSEALAEQRSAWAYLGALGALFCFLLVFGYACSDQRGNEVAGTDPVELMTGSEPSRLVFRIDGDVVAIQGSIPDQAAREQLLAAAQQAYGAENVVDELTVDADTTLESGTVRFVGSATFGDERPEALQESVGSTFGLANRGFEVGFVETVLSPVTAELALADGRVALSGVLPDDQSLGDLVAIAGEVWQPENVEASGLSVGATTWTDGSIRLTGSTTTTDDRVGRFGGLVTERIGALVTVDTSALTIVDTTARLAEVQTQVDELVAASPIQFAPDSPVISSGSDAVLVELAAALNVIPEVPFEVVGHTDSVGPEQDNLQLSQERAAAVVARLTELGVDPGRMTSRGEGEENPIADNTTDEGKAANRRIEFILVGTSEAEASSE